MIIKWIADKVLRNKVIDEDLDKAICELNDVADKAKEIKRKLNGKIPDDKPKMATKQCLKDGVS